MTYICECCGQECEVYEKCVDFDGYDDQMELASECCDADVFIDEDQLLDFDSDELRAVDFGMGNYR